MSLGSGIHLFRIRDPPIPDPGSRGQKGTGSRIRIRNTGSNSVSCFPFSPKIFSCYDCGLQTPSRMTYIQHVLGGCETDQTDPSSKVGS
jgi:hypothetical protein